jgi:hypothetical protein
MNYLRDLEYSEFLKLMDYLDSISENTAISLIGNFFPKLSALQELEIGYIIDSKDEQAFEKFKSDYPDLEIDEQGKSEAVKKDYWEITEKSLNYTYDMAFHSLKSNNFLDNTLGKVNTQIYNAKTLACLNNMTYQDDNAYLFKRKLFIDKFRLGFGSFNNAEIILKNKGLDASKFFVYVIAYCKDKKYENFSKFLDHLFRRIELISKDTELKSSSNKEFLDNIISIINKNK